MSLNQVLFNSYLWCERRYAGLKAAEIAVEEGTLSYLEGGRGKTLLMLHGFGANKDNWNKLAHHLTSEFNVICLDLPGFGQSFISEKLDYSLNAQLQRLKQFFEAKNLSDVILVGNSYGGYLAANLAVLMPDKVASLVLLNPLGVEGAEQSSAFKEITCQRRNVLLPCNVTEFTQLIGRCFHKRPFLPKFAIEQMAFEALSKIAIRRKIFYDVHFVSGSKVMFERPLEDALQQYHGSVDVYWGAEDKILDVDGGHILDELFENVNLVEISDVGHLPMLEVPRLVANGIMSLD